jgi:hypothetical protein
MSHEPGKAGNPKLSIGSNQLVVVNRRQPGGRFQIEDCIEDKLKFLRKEHGDFFAFPA